MTKSLQPSPIILQNEKIDEELLMLPIENGTNTVVATKTGDRLVNHTTD